jgi:hypothetical protein
MAKVLVLAVILTTIGIAGTEEKLGDITDGSRAMPIHLIPLLAEPLPDKEPDQIHPGDEPVLPFSTKQTCGACHSYGIISTGWHFNAIDPNVNPGRRGQAWILADPAAATQIPLSYRAWPGTFRPEQLGITPMGFLQLFGRQMPGGGIGEMLDTTDNPDERLKIDITGQLEINCLACHNISPGQDMGSAAGYAIQIVRGNYRWAATASSEVAYVTGSTKGLTNYDFRAPFVSSDIKVRPPVVEYRKESFSHNDWIRFDVSRDIPKQRCYFCHSNIDVRDGKTEPWKADEDVHIAAGLKCVNCHSHGLQHNITRGYAYEPNDSNNVLAAVSSCQGCHLGKDSNTPVAGRFAAPVPKHSGLPPTHLEKLSCTACHSGPWPTTETIRTKTARAHAIGVAGANKSGDVLPHLIYPVFARGQDGRIGVFKAFWPAYWAAMSGDTITPLNMDTVKAATAKVIAKSAMSKVGDWPDLKEDDISKILTLLVSSVPDGAKPVYIAGGRVYLLGSGVELASIEHPVAAPYMWPIAHDVRPAAQSLGVRRCEDCHSPDSPFLFGKVCVDSPVEGKSGLREMKDMYEFAGPVYVRVNWFFRVLIIGVMALLILHILGDLYRRVMLRLFKRAE